MPSAPAPFSRPQASLSFTLTTEKLPSPAPVFPHNNPVHGGILTRTAKPEFRWYSNRALLTYHGPATVRAELNGEGVQCEGVFEQEALANMWQEDVRAGCLDGVNQVFWSLIRLDCMLSRLREVIRSPSLGAIIRHCGIEVGLRWPDRSVPPAVERPTPFGPLPTCWVPFAIEACGEPALDGRIQFTWKREPLLLSAGVLQVEAWRPDDATRRVTVRLVSARRGVPPDSPDPGDLGMDLRVGMSVAEVCKTKGGVVGNVVGGWLADGCRAELVEFRVPRTRLHGAVRDGVLLFASVGSTASLYYLRHRGFSPDVTTCDPGSPERR